MKCMGKKWSLPRELSFFKKKTCKNMSLFFSLATRKLKIKFKISLSMITNFKYQLSCAMGPKYLVKHDSVCFSEDNS